MCPDERKQREQLSQRVAKGGAWVFSLRITQRVFNLIRLIILARILTPHDFGLMGIGLLAMSTLNTFTQTGFQRALIQKKNNIESYLNCAWTVLILRGLVLFATLLVIAPYVATFFKAPLAKPLIQIIGLAVLFQAFTNVGVIYFQKELEFQKQFFYQLSGILVDFIVAVSAALILKNAWALVYGFLAGNFVSCIVSYIVHPYRPHLSWDLVRIKELFGFGKWILGSSVLVFLVTQGDDIFVGKLLGITALGFYQMAYRISNIPATEITHVISRVTFPAYSKLQDNLPRLKEAYSKTLQFTVFLAFPIAGLIFILAADFTRIFLGEKWMPMVPAMQILALVGLFRSIIAIPGPLYLARKTPNLSFKKNIFRLILTLGTIYPLLVRYGIIGVAFSVLLGILAALAYDIYYFKRIANLNIQLKRIVKDLSPICVSAFLFYIILVFMKTRLGPSFLNITFTILFALVIYVGSNYFCSKIYGHTIMKDLNHMIKQLHH